MIGAEESVMTGFKEYEDFDAVGLADLVRRNQVTPDERSDFMTGPQRAGLEDESKRFRELLKA